MPVWVSTEGVLYLREYRLFYANYTVENAKSEVKYPADVK